MKLKKVRGYNFCRPFMGERAPQHVQNIVIREYCKKNNLLYLLSSTEYAMENCHLMLEQVLGELKSNTNQELFKTNKFVSDGYIDTYTIKSGKISLEFKKELN